MADLSVDLGFLKLRNPVLTASGTFGYGLEFAPYLDLSRLGGLVVIDTELARPNPLFRSFPQSVVLPLPDGADITKSFPLILDFSPAPVSSLSRP